ncbi:molybdopterin synthase sulfur carrier subunit [Dyadobacter jejuensis]|uniref:Molybdopterin synthase sulfur carrier subunit n=1 Tax=Dyadobacter jejuensis TaxID=1082580 RepID=A0A316ASW2_9BACT|nr:MoaD/ThiS family protein [Dyadobacter jejuensis]PWJ60426.1 molybdopterin synthase sulfur carrier subunit [Dyadobacter jejuensis]
MNIQILYFGQIADRIGLSAENFDWTSGLLVSTLREQILAKYPILKDQIFKIAVNQKIMQEDMPIPFPAEIACLPPFAGG